MGWASGADLAIGVWKLFRKYIPEEERAQVAKQLIEEFRMSDWDTVDEAVTLATDAHWYNQEEYDAICVDTNSVTDSSNDSDPEEADSRSDDPYHDIDCRDDEGPTPR